MSARSRLVLAGVALIAAGLALLWYAAGAAGVLAAIGAGRDVARPSPLSLGAQIYQASCSGCHGGATGGTIDDYPPRHNANGHTWQHGDCELVAVIRTGVGLPSEESRRPAAAAPALSMPAFSGRLTDEEVADVIAFIRTMWTDAERAFQETRTRERCGPS